MDLLVLALIVGAGAVGALLAAVPKRMPLPVVVGELLVGVLIGRSWLDLVNVDHPLLKQLGDLGFATVMLVAGSHVPVRDPAIRRAARGATAVVLASVPLAVGVGLLLAWFADTANAPLYAVLMASTSAALVLPVLGKATTPSVLQLMAQAAIADTVCIVALPLVADPRRALGAALGGLAVAVGATVVFALGHLLAERRLLHPLHRLSKEHHLGLALRASLVLLLLLAGTAEELGTSIMLAGFSCGLVLSALGEPRRLAKQLFAVSDGFLAPVFFVRLGATLDLRALGANPSLLLLGMSLGVGAVAVHVLAGRVVRQPLPVSVLAAAQLGVPVAAVTIGQQSHALRAGESAAIMLGALVTIAGTAVASRFVPQKGAPDEGDLARRA